MFVAERHQSSAHRAAQDAAVLNGIPESFVIGGSLITGGSVSIAIVAAAFISNIPEGLASTAGLKSTGKTKREIILLWINIIIVSGISSLVGYLVLDKTSPDVGAFAQAFAAGAMLTMLADTMMPEAFEESGKWALDRWDSLSRC